jgi:hypothetical protein
MPLAAAVVGSAIVGAGASIYSSSQAKKAADKSLDAQNQAAQQQLAAQQANFNRIDTLNQPFIQGGTAAFDKLLNQYGITRTPQTGGPATSPVEQPGANYPTTGFGGAQAPPGYSFGPNDALIPTPARHAQDGAPAPSTPPQGGPEYPGAPQTIKGAAPAFDAKAYLAQNPDVLANAQQRVKDGTANSVEDVAWEHYNAFGKNEGRDEPMTSATPDQVITPDYMNGTRPDAPAAPTFNRAPDMAAPSLSSYLTDFKADPGYQFRVNEAIKGVNAGSAVRGKLRSGDAALAIEGRASDLANQGYNDWFQRQMAQFGAAQGQYQYGQSRQDNNFSNDRAYGTSLWQNNRDFNNTNFNTDRGYQTGRYDTNTGNLFNLTDIGLRGAGNVSGAGTNLANSQSNIYGSQANAASDAAYARANANSQLAGGLAGAAGNMFAAWGGGAGAIPASGGGQTVGQAWNSSLGGGWQTPYAGSVNPYYQPVF